MTNPTPVILLQLNLHKNYTIKKYWLFVLQWKILYVVQEGFSQQLQLTKHIMDHFITEYWSAAL